MGHYYPGKGQRTERIQRLSSLLSWERQTRRPMHESEVPSYILPFLVLSSVTFFLSPCEEGEDGQREPDNRKTDTLAKTQGRQGHESTRRSSSLLSCSARSVFSVCFCYKVGLTIHLNWTLLCVGNSSRTTDGRKWQSGANRRTLNACCLNVASPQTTDLRLGDGNRPRTLPLYEINY